MRKRVILTIRRFIMNVFRGFGFKISIILLVFSAAVSLMILIPNCFDRVPVYSYFISELKLPLAYELTGNVEVLDKDNNNVNKNVEVFVGGYSTTVNLSGLFSLKFSSPITSEIFVTIRYTKPNGITETRVEILKPRNGERDLERKFIFHV